MADHSTERLRARAAPLPWITVVRELQVESDYGQIYIYDPQTQLADDGATEDDEQLQRALDDGYESRRFVGYDTGLVDLITPSQYNWNAPMRIEVGDDAPPLDTADWDHVVEVPLPIPSGTLCFQASGGGRPSRPRSRRPSTARGSPDGGTSQAPARSKDARATGCNSGPHRRRSRA